MENLTIQALKAYNRGKSIDEIQTVLKKRLNVQNCGVIYQKHSEQQETVIKTVMALYGNYSEALEFGERTLYKYMQQFNGLPLEVSDNQTMKFYDFGTFHDYRKMWLLLDRYVEKMQVINEPASNQIIISITLY